MTTFPPLSPDALALCRCIDAWDGYLDTLDDMLSALSILADWLEDAGDTRVAGIRWAVDNQAWPQATYPDRGYRWFRRDGGCFHADIPVRYFDRLPHGSAQGEVYPEEGEESDGMILWSAQPTRHEAFLALAEALTTVPAGAGKW